MKHTKLWGNLSVLLILMGLIGGIVWKVNHPQDQWNKTQQKKIVVVGVDDTFVPMGFRNQKGELVGYDVDLARKTFQAIGLQVKFQVIDWSMKETELKSGHIDAIWNGYTATDQRAKHVAFSTPYHQDEQVILTVKDRGFNQLTDLNSLDLGIQTGSSGAASYDEHPKLLKKLIRNTTQYDDFSKALNDLQVNRIQGVLIDSDYARYYMAHSKQGENFKIIKTPFPKEQFVVGFRKSDLKLRTAVNKQLAKFKKDSTMNELAKKYF
ncbi:amino acid ABC transporter substrate-binding protein [Weissella coleopterorum]|uniref:Amino acid ABC transporter substrate-binding protein n=1 Tax=Weissella coleopterorum TaxID=2714949 RepID=A0A6G8B0X4_9LACO|nr:amino acid ABC transporter substrate-binding protein [Weissella coleopterorum]QIL50869.1 amino acid ABC transporter substrate-binding protein [Weissella coleopterorum]